MFQLNQRIYLKSNPNKKGKINEVFSESIFEILWDNDNIETINGNEIQEEKIESPCER